MTKEVIRENSFEQINHREIERKFYPLNPEALLNFREQSRPIEQFYLSSQEEEFSLRFREATSASGKFEYTATLKDRGTISTDGLDRLEVEVPISSDIYKKYKSPELPCLKKLRTNVGDKVIIDYYEDGYCQVEAESPVAWQQFRQKLNCDFIDVTSDKISDNESRANQLIHMKGSEKPNNLQPEDILRDILPELESSEDNVSLVRICGRSGSGKSTIAKHLQHMLDVLSIDSKIISTDDYNRGLSYLKEYNQGEPWQDWDDPVVYDTKSAAADIEKLLRGEPVAKRKFDFCLQEPVEKGVINPSRVIIIEGIYAFSSDLDHLPSRKYEVSTPLATCMGRRLLRDLKERPTFDLESNLRYILEKAEPMYRRQNQVKSIAS